MFMQMRWQLKSEIHDSRKLITIRFHEFWVYLSEFQLIISMPRRQTESSLVSWPSKLINRTSISANEENYQFIRDWTWILENIVMLVFSFLIRWSDNVIYHSFCILWSCMKNAVMHAFQKKKTDGRSIVRCLVIHYCGEEHRHFFKSNVLLGLHIVTEMVSSIVRWSLMLFLKYQYNKKTPRSSFVSEE